MFSFADTRATRKPGLTPLIDVVFLLLVFFMLASQFGRDVALPLNVAGDGVEKYEGPPRLVTITSDGVLLNGMATPLKTLTKAMAELSQSPSDIIVIQSDGHANVQTLTNVMTTLSKAGYTALVLKEQRP